MYLVYANRVGFEDGVGFWGGSEILGPSGEILARARYYEADMIVAEVNLGAVRRKRIAAPMLRDENLDLTINELTRIRGREPAGVVKAPPVEKPPVRKVAPPRTRATHDARQDREAPQGSATAVSVARASTATPPAIPINTPVLRRILVAFIRNEVRKVGVERVVLGLSGGVDSSLAAFLAAEALGPANVLGICMPYRSSSPESLAHAELVAQATGIATATIEITPQIDAYFERFPDATPLRRGNKMARERMTILYDHSASWRALVLGTSNKTELLLGYGTLHGDMASALNPIGDLYKTQVWALSAAVGVPAPIIEKQPTADLWQGQTDEHELGFEYREVDRLLYLMVDERYEDEELTAAGFAPAFVARVRGMVQRSQFKRRLPVIAKVSARTIDRDFRYARDWGC